MAKRKINDYIFEPGISKDANLFPNAHALFVANKEFLKAQVVAFINYNIENSVGVYAGYTYSSSKCFRDVGYFLDAIEHDLRYGGNVKIRQVADYFWIDGQPMIRGDVSPEITGQQYIRDLLNNYIFTNTPVTPTYDQLAVSQVTIPGSNGEAGAAAANTALWTILGNVITNGTTAIPAKSPGVSSIRIREKIDPTELLLITDTTTGTVLYNFADPANSANITFKRGYSSGNNEPLSDLDFAKWWQASDTITTIDLSANTSTLTADSEIQIFVEDPYQTIRPWDFGTDAIERIRVAAPQAMLDADFEYGLQPTKWQAIGVQLGYPSIYEIPGTDVSVSAITTDASATTNFFGASEITVTTRGPHGFSVGTPITVKGLATGVLGTTRAEGSFLIGSIPTPFTFTYFATAKVGITENQSIYTNAIQIRQGGFYTGSSIGTPTFTLVSNGVTSTITTQFITSADSSNISFVGTAPGVGSPISGSPNILSGTSVTGVVGASVIEGSVKNTTTALDTFVDISNTSGVQAGMAVANELGEAVFISNVLGNRLSLSGAIGQILVGSDGTNTGITGTNIEGIGEGAVFDVARSAGIYSVVNSEDSTNNGQNYAVGDVVKILGTSLGGSTPENDLQIYIQTVDSGGAILSFATEGTSISGGATYSGITQTSTTGIGTSTTINVERTGGSGVYVITIANGGAGHVPGDEITFSGLFFDGATPENDIVIRIDGVSFGTQAAVDFSVMSGVGVSGNESYVGLSVSNVARAGAGAVFTITRLDGSYQVSTTNAGTGYRAGNKVLILGTTVSGTSPLNDIEVEIQTVNETTGAIQSLLSFGNTPTGSTLSIYPTLTLSEPTTGIIISGTVLNSGALATVEVEFTANHGLLPGSAILANITSTPAPAFTSSAVDMPASLTWQGIAASNGEWVAVANGSASTGVSLDGAVWSAGGALPASANWTAIAGGLYNGTSVFIAVRNGSNDAARSVNGGASWSTVTLPTVTNTTWTSVTYYNEVFVAVRSGSAGAAYSIDGGATWSTGTLSGTSTWTDVAGGTIGSLDYFVAIASGGTVNNYSFDNGATWVAGAALPSSSTWSSIAYGNSRFVAIASGTTAAAVSTDGTSWTAVVMPANTTWNSIAFGDDVFVAISRATNIVATSFTGTTDSWTQETLISTSNWEEIAYYDYNGFGVFTAVGNNTVGITIALTSANHQLASGPFVITEVPSPTTLRYPVRTTGLIIDDVPLAGAIYSRPESFFVHRPYDGGVQLGTGGPQHGAQAIRQSKKYIRYQSGKGIMFTTGALFAPSYDLQSASAAGLTAGSLITFVTDDTDHGLQAGGIIEITGMTSFEFNGVYTVESIRDSRTFRVRSLNVLTTLTPILGPEAKIVVKTWHGSTVRTGPFDDQNGLFWQYDGQYMALVKRTATFQVSGQVAVNTDSNAVTGTNTRFRDQLKVGDRVVLKGMTHTITSIPSQTSLTFNPDFRGNLNVTGAKMCLVEDTVIPQSEWNLDRVDGTGPSGFELNPGRMQMIGIQYSWYAAGFIEFMLRGADGKFVFVHRIRNSNINTEAYMRTANLPVRYEVENISAKGQLYTALANTDTSMRLVDAYYFPTAGTLYVGNELISYSGKSGNTLTGLTRAASFSNFAQGSTRVYTAGDAATYAENEGVTLISNTVTPAISHWGSALLTDGMFDEDRGYLFSYAATAINITTTKTTAFLIRLGPSVSNAIVGDLGERELLNRAQLLLKEISVTSDTVTGGGGIVVEGVLNPQNYPINPANINWGNLNGLASGGQPSFAQIAPGGTVDWASGVSQVTKTASTATGNSQTRRNFLYFKAQSWEAMNAQVGQTVQDPTKFPAGTTVTQIFGPANYIGGSTGNEYLVYFSQNSITTIAGDTSVTFVFGQPPYALPGETIFSFIANPGERATLDLVELKELTTTALGGRGAFPNGPDVLAINVYKVAGTATSGNIILRWGEAQA